MSDTNEAQGEKWSSLFIEIALRAIRRVHYEYGLWGIGTQWKMNMERTKSINMGHGIELADERSVCAAITQEFLASPSVGGMWIEGDQEEERYFAINREQSYNSNKALKVDIYLEKFKGKDMVPVLNPSFIEAKRARLWTPDLKSGTALPNAYNQIEGVKKDIKKLRLEMKCRGMAEAIHCHLLVWGIFPGDHPIDFLKELGDVTLKLKQTRWLPLEWTQLGERDDTITVKRSLWVSLIEVFSDV